MLENYLKKLVSFKTITSDKKANKKALDWCASEFKKYGFKIKYLKSNQVVSLYASKNLNKNPNILLAGHIDVVNASSALFNLKRKAGKLVGRGVFDMKYALACYLQLVRDVGELMKNCAILITTDEEVGGRNGTGYFVSQKILPRVCILPDGGKDFIFERSAKGILQLQILSKGKPAHGSRPWEGENALENLMVFLKKLKAIFPKEPCGDTKHRHNSISINCLNSGYQVNLIPDLAEAKVDIRVNPSSSLSSVRQSLLALKKSFVNISVKELSNADAFHINVKNKDFLHFSSLVKNKTGKSLKLLDSPGTCDARYFVNKGIPCVVLRPEGGGHHTEEEWIGRKGLQQFYEILRQFILEKEKSN